MPYKDKNKTAQCSKQYYLEHKDELREYKRKYQKRNYSYDNRDREKLRRYRLGRKFGITPEQYNEMLIKQNGVCAICLKPEIRCVKGRISNLAIDHNHITGKIRGLLCYSCNIGLGMFKDNSQTLRNAILYLEK